MADIVTPAKRSQMMAGIRGKNTKPELIIRRGLHQRGFRFRLHDKKLPGKPDLVFPKHRAVLLIHGCFWHGHDCHLFKWPSTRQEFWRAKIERNQNVDMRNERMLREIGWRVGTVWECALKGKHRLPINVILSLCNDWLLSNEDCMTATGNLDFVR